MKAKTKRGGDLLSFNRWNMIRDDMIINFVDKGTYEDFRQERNHLIIHTIDGDVDIVFTGDTPLVEFESYCKDQLVLKIKRIPIF